MARHRHDIWPNRLDQAALAWIFRRLPHLNLWQGRATVLEHLGIWLAVQCRPGLRDLYFDPIRRSIGSAYHLPDHLYSVVEYWRDARSYRDHGGRAAPLRLARVSFLRWTSAFYRICGNRSILLTDFSCQSLPI